MGLADIFTGWFKQLVPLVRSYRWHRTGPETDPYGIPLHQAAAAGDVSSALTMLHVGAAINERDKLGRSPLHAAVQGGEPRMVRALIEEGAKLEQRDKRGQTPLYWAAYMGQTGVLYHVLIVTVTYI